MVPSKYISNSWATLEMLLINWKVILYQTDKKEYVSNARDVQVKTFTRYNARLYLPVVTLSTQDNAELFEQLKSGFTGTDWNKYQPKQLMQV